MKCKAPSMDEWMREAKRDPASASCGMFLFHNGVVRETAKARVRGGDTCAPAVLGMHFDYDEEKVNAAVQQARRAPGIAYVRAWLNRGTLSVGDDIMLVLVGGDIRPHVIDALQSLVAELKGHCVVENEIQDQGEGGA